MIRESLAAGLVVVLAYQHPDLDTIMNEATRLKTVAWWRDAAAALRNDSHALVFNTFIEVHPNNTLPSPPLFNAWTADIAAAVRETNPTRVLILAPPGPDLTNLVNLTAPKDCGGYCMAEWHDWAGGPGRKMRMSGKSGEWDEVGMPSTELEEEEVPSESLPIVWSMVCVPVCQSHSVNVDIVD